MSHFLHLHPPAILSDLYSPGRQPEPESLRLSDHFLPFYLLLFVFMGPFHGKSHFLLLLLGLGFNSFYWKLKTKELKGNHSFHIRGKTIKSNSYPYNLRYSKKSTIRRRVLEHSSITDLRRSPAPALFPCFLSVLIPCKMKFSYKDDFEQYKVVLAKY